MTVHIDNEQLAELKDVLEDEFGILISTYLADAKLRLQLIEQGLQNQDYDAVRLAAHSLKGASANLGALILAKLCERLEHDCRVGFYDNCVMYHQKIVAEFAIVKDELRKLA